MTLPHAARKEAIEAQLKPNERRWLKWLRRTGWALAATYFLVAAAMLGLRFWVLPGVADYKPQIAAAVSRALGERVEIGAIDAEWYGLRPRLELAGVKVLDRRGEEALALPYVAVTVAWQSLLAGELRFRSIVLDGADLSVRRDPQGRIFVAGLEMKPDEAADGSAADWALKQGEIIIREATVEWHDEYRRAPPIRLERVDFALQNDGRHHRFAIRAKPPRELASALDVRGHLIGRTVEQLKEWNGRVYAAFDYIDLAAWQAWVDYPVEVRGGRGALRLWLGFADQRLTELAADIALADVAARFGPKLPLAEVQTVRGQFGATKRSTFELIDLDGEPDIAYDAFARQLALVMKGGAVIALSDFNAHWEPPQGGAPARGTVVARSVELAPLALLGEYLPFPTAAHEALIALAPEGRVADVQFNWTGDIERPATYAARGKFAALGMRPYGDAPGFENLSGTFDLNDKGGGVTLAAKDVTFEYPKIFVEPTLAFDAIAARVGWSFPQGDLQLRLDDVAFSNRDIAGTVTGTYRSGGVGVRGLDVAARLARVEGKHVYKYIPFLRAPVSMWLRDRIQSGALGDARLRLRGDLNDFPFDDPRKGEFKVSGRVTGGTLEYADRWPMLTNIAADLAFDGRKLKISSPRASALGAQLSRAVVTIPDLFGGRIDVVVDGEAQGPIGEFLKFIAHSPVREFLDGLTDRWTADGRGNLKLHLALPLDDLGRSKLAGSFQFGSNRLSMGPGEPTLMQVNGRVEFTESGVTARNLTAQTLGGSLSVQIATRDGAVTASVQGTVDSTQLARSLALPIADRVRGPVLFKHTATTSRERGGTSVFESSLAGVTVDLPPPFAKPAGESWPLRIERTSIAPSPGEALGAKRESVVLSLANLLNAQAQIRSEDGRMIVERAGVGIGDVGVPLPDRAGVFVAGNVPTLDLDRLLAALTAAGDRSGSAEFNISALSLRAGTLTVVGRVFHDVAVRAQFDSWRTWRADVTANELAGEVAWRPEGQGAVRARLKHLIHPERAPGVPEGDDFAQELPALMIDAESYTFNGHELGRLELRAVNEQNGWRLRKLELTAPEGTLTATGLWEPPARATERTQLDVKVKVTDVGKYLARFGYPGAMAKGTATLDGAVHWHGPVYRIDYGSLAGDLKLKAAKGQFVHVEPGVGKLLGVLSLQSLPRRLTLDFRDIFTEGFAFDSINGSAKIARGVATTQDLAMAGPAASVAITGQADLAQETQDLTVRVVPTVGDSVAVAAGFALVNPILGAGALLAQRLLKDPLGRAFAFEYQVTGSWEDPKVIKVRGPEPPEAAEQPGAAPKGEQQ